MSKAEKAGRIVKLAAATFVGVETARTVHEANMRGHAIFDKRTGDFFLSLIHDDLSKARSYLNGVIHSDDHIEITADSMPNKDLARMERMFDSPGSSENSLQTDDE